MTFTNHLLPNGLVVEDVVLPVREVVAAPQFMEAEGVIVMVAVIITAPHLHTKAEVTADAHPGVPMDLRKNELVLRCFILETSHTIGVNPRCVVGLNKNATILGL